MATLPPSTLSLSDSVSTTAAHVVLISETIGLTDSVSTGGTANLEEFVSLTDSISTTAANIVVLPAETLSLSHTISVIGSNTALLPPSTLSLSDSVSTTAAHVVLISETIGLTDTVSATAGKIVDLPAETLSLVDVLSNVKSTEVAIVESLLLREEYANQPTNIVRMDTEIDEENEFYELGIATGVDTFTLTGTYAGTYAIVTAVEDNGVQIIELSSTTGVSVVTSKIVDLPPETLSLTDFVTQPIAIPPPIEGTVNLLEFVILADVSITSDPGASSSIITDVIVTTGNEQIGVTWTIDSDEVGDVCNFQIWYATSAGGPWTL